uniref:Uncharacterized protein n=2 Tax=Aegilops tauschii subsp. strangulata TaxID=200361 RepID=A0A453G526_AEGTS
MHLKIPCDFSPETSNWSFNSRKPDYCLGLHLWQMLSYGCIRFHICVQSTNRGHTIVVVADCFSSTKDVV